MDTLALFTNSLTMARYYAARGISYIHFHIDGDDFNVSDFDEIYPWISGVDFVLSSDILSEEELFNMYHQDLPTILFLRRENENYILVNKENSQTIRPYRPDFYKDIDGILITENVSVEELDLSDRLIAFFTPCETEPGIVDYEKIDKLLDTIVY